MTQTPSISYSCPHCGANQTYRIVPGDPQQQVEPADFAAREIPSIDLSCPRCGANQTYRIVPDGVASLAMEH